MALLVGANAFSQEYPDYEAAGTKKEAFDMEKLAMEVTSIVKDPFDAQHLPLTGGPASTPRPTSVLTFWCSPASATATAT